MWKLAQRRAEVLGVPFDEVLKKAEISRSTIWRGETGKASVATLRRVEDKLTELEEERGIEGESAAARLRVWNMLGVELLLLDDSEGTFNEMIGRVQRILDLKKEQAEAMSALSRPLPPRDE